jgi:hypothetical protein
MCTKSSAEKLLNSFGTRTVKQEHVQMSGGAAGGYPADVNGVSNSMSLVSINRAAGGAVSTQNVQSPVHVLTQLQVSTYGIKSAGEEGLLRYHEFKNKLTPVFKFNAETGSIFAAKINSNELGEFIDELYLSYLLVYKENPSSLNAKTPRELNKALFNPRDQYMWFKTYIIAPNLKYNGHYGFPCDIGAKPIAERWLKM